MKTTLSGTSLLFRLLVLILFTAYGAPAQNWEWAVSGIGSASDGCSKSSLDPSGNIIAVGQFVSNPLQMGTVTLNNAGPAGTSDSYVVKLNPAGTVQWAQRIGGLGNEGISGVCTDASGNIYVHGNYSSSFLTVQSLNCTNSSTASTTDIYVACFNSSGIIQWLKSYGGPKSETAGGIAYSNSLSSVYITGSFLSASITAGTNTITNSDVAGNNTDIFLARLTSTGSVTWMKSAGIAASQDAANGVSIDSNSDPYIGGTFQSTTSVTSIAGTALTTHGGDDIYIAKYNSAGVGQWAKNLGTPANYTSDFIGGITIDPSNNVLVTGTYSGGSLIAGTFTVTNAGSYDAFAAKTNSLGVFQWVTKIAEPVDDYGNDIVSDAAGNAYVTGAFSGTNLAVGSTSLVNSNPGLTTDVFVMKFDPTGVAQWATSAKGADNEVGNGITGDAAGNLFVTGNYYTSPTAFGTTTLTSSGVQDLFIARMGCLSASVTGVSSVCSGSSATLTATGATSYTWSTGATTASIVITPTASASYSVLGAIGTCTGSSNQLSVSVLPASVNAGSDLQLMCNQYQMISATCTPSSPTTVVWSPTVGLSNASVLTPTVHMTNSTTQYIVSVSLSNGCSAKDTMIVSPYAPTPDICMVSVDSIGKNNLVLWDKSAYPNADTFFVYRDIANNVYKQIGYTLKSSAYGEYRDTARTLYTANGDPTVSAWRYKIAYRDSCGNMSPKSLYHKTIFIQNSGGNFSWNDYQIEGQPVPVPNLSNYIFRRDNNATGNWQNIQTLSAVSTAYTDPNYSLYTLTADWRTETLWSITCSSSYFKTTQTTATIKRSKSNVSNNRMIGIKEIDLSKAVMIYPNPVSGMLHVNTEELNSAYDITLENAIGQVVYQSKSNTGNSVINTSDLAKGFYSLKLQTANGRITKKVIVE